MLYKEERQLLIDTARTMEKYNLVKLSGGNVSMRMPCGNVLVTPSAMSYDTMVPEDIVLIDLEGNTVEGHRQPTSDWKAITYILRAMPEKKSTSISMTVWNLPGTVLNLGIANMRIMAAAASSIVVTM